MSYVCRIFTKDVKALQDVKDYKILDKDIAFIANNKDTNYMIDETEYVVIPTVVFKEMLDKIYSNGVNAKSSSTTKKNKKNSKADDFTQYMNAPELNKGELNE